jgi:hypothetical protein
MPVILHVPLLNNHFWDSIALILCHAVLIIFFIWMILLIIIAAPVVSSVRKRHLYCPWMLRPAYLLLERAVQTGCQMFKIDDTKITTILIQLENNVNQDDFAMMPAEKQIVLLSHCLRSTKCRAHLTPLGIKFLDCGKCGLEMATNTFTDTRYLVFIIPGSTYIKHLLKRLHPKTMNGIGYQIEIEQFQEFAQKDGIIMMIIVMKSDDCVKTAIAWEYAFEIASIDLNKKIGEGA